MRQFFLFIFLVLLIFNGRSQSSSLDSLRLVLPKGHTSFVLSAEFSPNNKYVVTASRDKSAKVWSVQSGKLIHELIGHSNRVVYACFSYDNRYVVTCSRDHNVILWDSNTGMLVFKFIGHQKKVLSARFTKDDKFLITSSSDKTIRIWDISNGNEVSCLKSDQKDLKKIPASRDGYKIVLTDKNEIQLFDLKNFVMNLWIRLDNAC